MNIKNMVRSNKLFYSILIFVIVFSIIHKLKPGIMYDQEGAFREFGVGYQNKTVLPIWLIAILMAILSYLAVLAYLMFL